MSDLRLKTGSHLNNNSLSITAHPSQILPITLRGGGGVGGNQHPGKNKPLLKAKSSISTCITNGTCLLPPNVTLKNKQMSLFRGISGQNENLMLFFQPKEGELVVG